MKRLLAPLVLSLVLAFSLAGCYGSYSAFHAVHRWNGHATGNKYINSGIHFVLLPINFGIILPLDVIVFNTVEFFTGNRVFN